MSEYSLTKGEWRLISTINDFKVLSGDHNEIVVANCYQNRSNAEFISMMPEFYLSVKRMLMTLKSKDQEGFKKEREIISEILIKLETKTIENA